MIINNSNFSHKELSILNRALKVFKLDLIEKDRYFALDYKDALESVTIKIKEKLTHKRYL